MSPNALTYSPAAFEPKPYAAIPAVTLNSAPLAADAGMLLRMLEEVDYGIALVTASGVLRFANQLGLLALTEPGPLRLGRGLLFAASDADQLQLRSALADAARGLRRLLHLGDGAHAVSVAVKPLMGETAANDGALGAPAATNQALAMLVFGKRQTCETLTLDIFARSQKLTGAEAAVLRGLCAGQRPKQIAAASGVAVSTVRTQINAIRVKTHTNSIRELVDRVAALPPITPAMKNLTSH